MLYAVMKAPKEGESYSSSVYLLDEEKIADFMAQALSQETGTSWIVFSRQSI